MKNSSVAILSALGLAGAAGVYLATRDPGEQKVKDLGATKVADEGSAAADGSSQDGTITLREKCRRLQSEDIPAAKARLADAQAELDDWINQPLHGEMGNPYAVAKNYRWQVKGGDQHEEDAFRYMVDGEPLNVPTPGNRRMEPWLKELMERAKTKVEGYRTTIDTYKTQLKAREDELLKLTSQGIC